MHGRHRRLDGAQESSPCRAGIKFNRDASRHAQRGSLGFQDAGRTVGRKLGSHLFRILLCQAVDYTTVAAAIVSMYPGQQQLKLALSRSRLFHHLVKKIRPVYASAEGLAVANAEDFLEVSADPICCSCCQGQDWGLSQVRATGQGGARGECNRLL